MKALASLRSALHAVAVTRRVSDEIRVSLQLVQTCHQDLQALIALRDAHLGLLEAAPAGVLARLHAVIDQAHRGLAAARCIVERCRPDGHKTPLHGQMEWVLSASSEFRRQEPLLSRHHAAVLAELTFVRQMTTWALLTDGTPGGVPALVSSGYETDVKVLTVPSSPWPPAASPWPPASTPSSNHATPVISNAKPIEYSDLPEPVFPGALPGAVQSVDNVSMVSMVSATRSAWGTVGPDRVASRNAIVNSSHNNDMSLLFED
ncbi:hypothetical protein CCM_06908 [Cordyceps militaris CM01]|uniref:Uncharacterized protein n=1 Tax=Cordyceps militaris (strain CM01) TaxID=983644 RepID=G3JLB4_CORMM|nr:uncharacterized protein CCM_06908 [Cordyceps militaris CM01]EGX90488.1 hypothetical protein CCM_06908 [Cordyceps militaris CM01]